MRNRKLPRYALPIVALLVGAQIANGQTPSKATAKATAAARAKNLMGKLADTAATSAASLGADSILGSNANLLAQAVGVGGAAAPCKPATAGVPTVPTMPTAGGLLVNVAKKRFFGGKAKDTTAAATPAAAADAKPCPPNAASAQQNMLKSAGSVALAASPAGMAVAGAAAAAPHAGKAIRTLNNRFRRGTDSKEGVQRDLEAGRLELNGITFAKGSVEAGEGFEAALTQLAEALGQVPGQFVLYVTAESTGATTADVATAARRAAAIAMHLQISGVDASRVTVGAATDAAAPPASKPGDARVVLVRSSAPQR